MIQRIVCLAACISLSFAAAQSGPSVDTAKQALNRRWQQLKPADAVERNVLFEDVRAVGQDRFQVTANIRDYSLGYPANRYYGQTCVAHIPQWEYTVSGDTTGAWQVNGRMTADLAQTKCVNNPSAGASSQPLNGVPGTPAPSGVAAAAPALARSSGVPQGSYECWAFSQARMLLNFTIQPGGQYTGSNGQPGAFSFDAPSQRITFRGGSLDGVLPGGFYAVYYEPQGRPTVSFRNDQGSEVSFCQKK